MQLTMCHVRLAEEDWDKLWQWHSLKVKILKKALRQKLEGNERPAFVGAFLKSQS